VNVAHQFREVTVAVADHRFVAVLKNMAVPAMAPVIAHRITVRSRRMNLADPKAPLQSKM
jgi:hypothetical protein